MRVLETEFGRADTHFGRTVAICREAGIFFIFYFNVGLLSTEARRRGGGVFENDI